jgi:hypothetical protein
VNKTIIIAGIIGVVAAAGLWWAGSGLDVVLAVRVIAMMILVLLAAKGYGWAAWILAAWFAMLGIVSAIGSIATGGLGMAIGAFAVLLFGGLGWTIVRASSRTIGDGQHQAELVD